MILQTWAHEKYKSRSLKVTQGQGIGNKLLIIKFFVKFREFEKTNNIPLRFIKAGRVWCGGARDTHWARGGFLVGNLIQRKNPHPQKIPRIYENSQSPGNINSQILKNPIPGDKNLGDINPQI